MTDATPQSSTASAKTQGLELTLRGLRKTFKSDLLKQNQTVLDGLSMTFPAGKCTGVLGHNGAGKTTTIRVVLGLIRPDNGDVLVNNQPISTETKRRIGYMPEVNKLPGNLTSYEALSFHLRILRPKMSRAEHLKLVTQMLDQVGLANHQRKKIRAMSKGMARRLAWGLATIHRPDLLIVDEPFSGLDPLGRREMKNWLNAEKQHGTTILLCTHELERVESLCDHFHVLRRGKVVLTTIAGQEGADGPELHARGLHSRSAYNLHLSGVDQAKLEQLQQQNSLPDWQSLYHEGYMAVLGFRQYPDATAWLETAIRAGIVVARFGDAAFVNEDDLIEFFRQEPEK